MKNLSACSDDELVSLFARGEKPAFEELVLRYKNALYGYLLSLVHDEGVAGDLFQDVFLALFTHADSFQAQGKVKAWLFLTARNKALNYFRDSKKEVSLDDTDEEGNAFWHELLPDTDAGQLEKLEEQEFLARVKKAVDQLPPRQREVLYLRMEFSFAQLAQMLGRPLGTVLADCHRALQRVRTLLASEESYEL